MTNCTNALIIKGFVAGHFFFFLSIRGHVMLLDTLETYLIRVSVRVANIIEDLMGHTHRRIQNDKMVIEWRSNIRDTNRVMDHIRFWTMR